MFIRLTQLSELLFSGSHELRPDITCNPTPHTEQDLQTGICSSVNKEMDQTQEEHSPPLNHKIEIF